MYPYFYLFLLAIIMLQTACQYDEKWQTATNTTSDGTRQFALLLPSYMQEEVTHRLNPTAKLQYCNYYRNVYAIVLDQAKSTPTDSSLQQYATRYLTDMAKTLMKPQQVDSSELQLDGLTGSVITLTGDLGQLKDLRERIYYQIAFLESPTHYYQVATWTWDSRRQNFAADLDSIIHSFQESATLK